MGPPPPPIDPDLQTYHAASVPSGIGVDPFLITSSPPLPRPYYIKELNLESDFPPENQVSSIRPRQMELNPSLNSYPDPWDPQRVNRETTQPQSQLMNQGHTGARQRIHPQGQMASYWSPQSKSDLDSSNGRFVHDSGYYTQTHGTGSVYSGDMTSVHSGGTGDVEARQRPMHYSTYPDPAIDNPNGFPGNQEDFPFDLKCSLCGNTSKNRSDFKYVFSMYCTST